MQAKQQKKNSKHFNHLKQLYSGSVLFCGCVFLRFNTAVAVGHWKVNFYVISLMQGLLNRSKSGV